MTELSTKISRLESQVGELLELCQKLGDDNNDLRGQLHHMNAERSRLLDQKEQARSSVEAMITRLKSMEIA